MVPFWVPIIIRHLLFRVPKKRTPILTTTHMIITGTWIIRVREMPALLPLPLLQHAHGARLVVLLDLYMQQHSLYLMVRFHMSSACCSYIPSTDISCGDT